MGDQLVVSIDEADADEARLDELARGLRTELLELDVDDVRQARAGTAPPGTRGLEVAAVGALLVAVPKTVEAVSSVVQTVRRWLARGQGAGPGGGPARKVRLTIGERTLELEDATAEQQERLVEQFLAGLPEQE